MAEGSLSTGRMAASQRSHSFISVLPAMTMGSLLASATVLPALIALTSGWNPTAPTTPLITKSADGREAMNIRLSISGGRRRVCGGTWSLIFS